MTDLSRRRGDTYGDEFAIKTELLAVVDITGYSFVLTVDPSKAPEDAANNLFTVVGAITDAPNGVVEFAPDAAQADQTPGKYYYDLQMTDTSGAIRTIDSGIYAFVQDISK